MEQIDYHRWPKKRVDSDQRRNQGISSSSNLRALQSKIFVFTTTQDSARGKNIEVTDVIHLDDYIPAQVETINKIAQETYKHTRSEFYSWT